MARPNNDQAHLRKIRDLYARTGCMPSYSVLAKALGFKAKNAAFKLMQRLVASGHLCKAAGGRLAPGPLFFTLELSDDYVRAGFGADTVPTGLVQEQALGQLLPTKPSKTVLVKVRGNSMVNAGIFSGDVAVVETGPQASHGDIVVAQIDGSCTVKELRVERGRARLVAHDGTGESVSPQHALSVIGVVRGIVRSYGAPAQRGAKLSRQGAIR